MSIIYRTNNLIIKNAKHGNFAFYLDDDPIGTCLFYYGEWAEQEFDVISKLVTPNTNCIDVGANIGTHTVWLSKHCPSGFIFAIEPQFYISQVLNTNITLNDCYNVVPLNIGIANTTGKMLVEVLHPTGLGNQQNYGQFSLLNQSTVERGVLIDIKKLDDIELYDYPIGFMKLDCELLEAHVLQSANRIITEYKPNMYIEFNRVEGNDEVLAILEDYGYNCYWHVYEKFKPDNFNNEKLNVWLDDTCTRTPPCVVKYFESNLIAIHKDNDKGEFTDKIERGDNIISWLHRHEWFDKE